MSVHGTNILNSTISSSVHTKYILLFTTFWTSTDWNLQMGSVMFEQCPFTNCKTTNNSRELSSVSEFDAILFHLPDMAKIKPEELPDQQSRRASQRYIMFFLEAPGGPGLFWTDDMKQFNDFFNWTMTYRDA